MNQLLIITGMDDKTRRLEKVTRNWPERYGLQPTVFAFGWENPAAEYRRRQGAIMLEADRLSELGTLSIMGVSAGGHKAVDLLSERPDIVEAAVNVCGLSTIVGWSGGSERHSLLRYSLRALAGQSFDPKRVMTLRPMFDELVPGETVPVEGATNIQMHTIGHIPSIAWALTGRAQTITDFITSNLED